MGRTLRITPFETAMLRITPPEKGNISSDHRVLAPTFALVRPESPRVPSFPSGRTSGVPEHPVYAAAAERVRSLHPVNPCVVQQQHVLRLVCAPTDAWTPSFLSAGAPHFLEHAAGPPSNPRPAVTPVRARAGDAAKPAPVALHALAQAPATPRPRTADRLVAARVNVHPPGTETVRRSGSGGITPAGEVRREMIAASGLSPDDARLILARRAGEMLEGGRLAQLAPARRQKLERLAVQLGLRAFDSSLVIAIAQDAARHDEPVEAASGRLALVPRPGAHEPRDSAAILWGVLAAAVVAAAALGALVRWVAGA